MPKVYIGCFGSGLGHATRMLEIASLLQRGGWKVRFSSSDEVARYIAGQGMECNALPLADVRYTGQGEFSMAKTLAASPAILGRTFLQLKSELSNLGEFDPDVVLSDSMLSTTLAGRLSGRRVFTILNQLNLASTSETSGVPGRLLSAGMSSGLNKMWGLSEEVLLPDLPPPYTISERNLWGARIRRARYIGLLGMEEGSGPDAAAGEFARDPRVKVFWQVSGPPATRGLFLQRALQIAPSLADEYVFVVAEGDPSAHSEAVRMPWGWRYGWCRIARRYFGACDVVVSRAGHGTVAQAILSAKPSLLVPIPKQPEQEWNAQKAARLGIALTLAQSDLNAAHVRVALRELRGEGRVARARELGAFALRLDAKREIIRAIEARGDRGRPERR